MKYDFLYDYLPTLKGVSTDFKAEWGWRRYSVGGKMFLAVCMDGGGSPYYITLKLPPEERSALRELYSDIIPGYYCNKRHWNSIKADGEVPAELVSELAFKAYVVVFASLPKKVREAIEKG